MEPKTKVHADPGKQELFITRDFNLPVESLYKAYTVPEYLQQWMGTQVTKWIAGNQGCYVFETTDPMGGKHKFQGTFHEWVPEERLVRTFEMAPFPPQLEFLEFSRITPHTSRLSIQIVFKSQAAREELLKLPFAWGINHAHDRLQELFTQSL